MLGVGQGEGSFQQRGQYVQKPTDEGQPRELRTERGSKKPEKTRPVQKAGHSGVCSVRIFSAKIPSSRGQVSGRGQQRDSFLC